MANCTVGVLFGGVSSEYEVSLRTAVSIMENIPRDKYTPIMIGITKEGQWFQYTGPADRILSDRWQQDGPCHPAVISPDRTHGGLLCLTPAGTHTVHLDVVFPAVHGENCEDGVLQGLFELAGIPYVGCGVLASSTCMDKAVTHALLECAGIQTAPYLLLTRGQDLPQLEQEITAQLGGYPVFVKPAGTGSSVGISKVSSHGQLAGALDLAFGYGRKVLIEQMLTGAEVECAVLGNHTDAEASVVGEIVPRHAFYDYAGKYLDDSTDLYVPARLSDDVAARVRATALRAFAVMGCHGLARVDFFAKEDGTVVLNELNTLPGFTSISMYPRLFAASGLPYPALIDRLLRLALESR